MTSPAPRRGRFLFLVVIVAALGAGAPGGAQQPPAGAAATPGAAPANKAPAAKAGAQGSEKSSDSYSLGVLMGSQLHNGGVRSEDVSTERVMAGFHDGLDGKVKFGEADRANLDKLLHRGADSLADSNHRAAAKFLAANGKQPDVVTTASGLQYKVLNPGSGDSPKSSDEVVVNYRGSLLDGTEFDSSYKHGQPATFAVGRVIPGWTEALQLMKPGGKYQVWIPPQLAYDTHPPERAPIPPGAMLIFDVELIKIMPPAAAAPAAPAPAPPAKGSN